METIDILPSPDAIFSHGKLYVTLIRVQNFRGLKILVCGGKVAVGRVLVKKVVYWDLFRTQVETYAVMS